MRDDHDMMARLQAQLPDGLTLMSPLGRGGMGQVYLAQDARLGEVVVKVMHAHLPRENAERLRLEAQALGRLVSPYIVRLYRWGLVGGRPYLVMEVLRGDSLGAWLDHGPMDPTTALRVARDVCLGLAVVHEASVVHRDIKPDNVFVCEERAVLLDFGVVKLIERVTGVRPLPNPTRAGAAVGTPRYMSPEQARAGEVDGRADLYGLGAMLFRMLTGEHLFPGEGLKDVLLGHVLEAPRRASEVAPTPLPAGVDELLLRALAKEADDRFSDAEAMAEAIEALVPGLVETRLEPPSPAPAAVVTEMLELPPDSESDIVTRAIRYFEPTPTDTETLAPPETALWPTPSPAVPTAPPAQLPLVPAPLPTPRTARRTTWPLVAVAAVLAFAVAVALAEALMS